MSEHYSDYLKKSVAAKDIVFEKAGKADKALISGVWKRHIKSNTALLVLLLIGFALFLWGFMSFILQPSPSAFIEIFSLAGLGLGLFITGRFIWSIAGPVSGIRKGVLLSSARLQEIKDERSRSYQYVFDIYMEDRDETLMSYAVDPKTFSSVQPGDGVFVVKAGRKIRIAKDPDRIGVMDVSRIRSGV